MKLERAERRMCAAAAAGLGLMLLLFAGGLGSAAPLEALPPAGTGAPRETPARPLVDLNAAGLEELTALPGIGEVRARAILDYREAHGPFRYPEELILVDGIGEGTVSGLLDYVTTGGKDDAEDLSG